MSYIGNQPVLQSTEFREEFFPSSNQTAFTTGGFHPSAVSVTRNGVLLSESDYTKGSDNVTITLNSAAISGDVVVIRGNRALAQGVSVSESRVEYTWQSGDTVVQLNADVIPAYTDVYLNGVKLAAADYSINASTKQVSFTSAPAVGDVIAVVHKNEASALVALPLKDSYGNEVLSQSGNAVSIGTLRLPTSGGIQDSSGANVLTEASGTVTLTADEANIGSNALVVDSSGNVGIGTDTVEVGDLQISSGLNIDRKNVAGNPRVYFGHDNFAAPTSNFIQVDRNTEIMSFQVNDSPRMYIDSSGNLLVGTQTIVAKSTFYGTNGTGTNAAIGIIDDEGDRATIGLTTAGNLYIKAENGEVSALDSAGNATQLSPHNFEMIPNGASESNAWAFYSRNGDVENDLENTSYVNVDMMKVIRLVENLTGVKLLYTGTGTNADTSTVTQNIIESQQSQIDALTARIEALEAN